MKLLIIITGIIALTACGQGQNHEKDNQTALLRSKSTYIDTSKIAIIHLDSTNNWMVRKAKPADLSLQEIAKIDSLLNDCITNYNLKQIAFVEELEAKFPEDVYDMNDYTIDLSQYFRQYVPTINENGEKEVWIICFCGKAYSTWRIKPKIVDDGGKCYFNLKVNLATEKCFDLMVNGHA